MNEQAYRAFCPKCGARYAVPDKSASGKRSKCTRCGEIFISAVVPKVGAPKHVGDTTSELQLADAPISADLLSQSPPSPLLVERRKPCPFCAELILEAAKVCRYCRRDLGNKQMMVVQQPAQQDTVEPDTEREPKLSARELRKKLIRIRRLGRLGKLSVVPKRVVRFEKPSFGAYTGSPVPSFTWKAFATLFLYLCGWVPGFVTNCMFYSEAKAVYRRTGYPPDGMGALGAMFIVGIVLLILWVIWVLIWLGILGAHIIVHL